MTISSVNIFAKLSVFLGGVICNTRLHFNALRKAWIDMRIKRLIPAKQASKFQFLRTCKQIHTEGPYIFFSKSTFYLPTGPVENAIEWYDGLPNQHSLAIRTMVLNFCVADILPSLIEDVESKHQSQLIQFQSHSNPEFVEILATRYVDDIFYYNSLSMFYPKAYHLRSGKLTKLYRKMFFTEAFSDRQTKQLHDLDRAIPDGQKKAKDNYLQLVEHQMVRALSEKSLTLNWAETKKWMVSSDVAIRKPLYSITVHYGS